MKKRERRDCKETQGKLKILMLRYILWNIPILFS